MLQLPPVGPPVSDLGTGYTFARLTGWTDKVRNRLETARFTSFDSVLVLTAVVLLYLAITALSATRQLWHDELFTYYIAKSPSMSQFWAAIRLDLNPPLSYLAVRGSLALLGDNSYATRFPSIVAFLVGSLCFYWFVSRRLRPVYGLLAMLVFWSTPFLSYATEARPYGLIFGFFGIAMLAWERAIEPDRSKASVALLALAVTGMALSHFFALFYVLPFCGAELVRWYRSRKVDLPLWASLVIPSVILFIYIRTISGYEGAVFPPAFQASPRKMAAFFYDTLSPESLILLFAISLALLVVFRREQDQTEATALMKPVELAFTAGLLAIPVIVNLALMRSHSAFFLRYGLPAVLAYGILIAFFIAMYTNSNRLAAAVASAVLLIYVAGLNLAMPAKSIWAQRGARAVSSPASPIELVRPDLPLVAASGLTFLEMDKYANPSIVSRLYYLDDLDLAVRYAHATIFEGYAKLKQYFPIRANVEPYRQFVTEHSEFLVLGTPDYPEDWLLRRLLDIHATVQYLGDFPGPYKDTQLYQVSMPKGSY